MRNYNGILVLLLSLVLVLAGCAGQHRQAPPPDESSEQSETAVPERTEEPERTFDPVAEAYYDYLSAHDNFAMLLSGEKDGGFSDAEMAAFTIGELILLGAYDMENGNPKEAYDAITEKYFGTTIKDFNTSKSTVIPETGNITSTGWGGSIIFMVLRDIAEQADGTVVAHFYRLSRGMSDELPAPEIVKRDLLTGQFEAYGPVWLDEMHFEEKRDESGELYLKYISITSQGTIGPPYIVYDSSKPASFPAAGGAQEVSAAPSEPPTGRSESADEPVAPDPPPAGSNGAYIKRWDERTVSEQYSLLRWDDAEYHVNGGKVDPSQVGARLGGATAWGHDAYDGDRRKELSCQVYALSSISPACGLAVKYDGYQGFFPFTTYMYQPETLGDLINDLSLRQNLVFGSIYYGYWQDGDYRMATYTLPDASVIWSLLLSDPSVKNSGDAHYGASLMDISIDVKVIGSKNIALSVNGEGYLQTNILGTGKSFYIGKDKVDAFVGYVLQNGAGTVRNPAEDDEVAVPE